MANSISTVGDITASGEEGDTDICGGDVLSYGQPGVPNTRGVGNPHYDAPAQIHATRHTTFTATFPRGANGKTPCLCSLQIFIGGGSPRHTQDVCATSE